MRERAAGLSPAVTQLLEQAAAALGRQELDAAEAALASALALEPDCIEAQRLLGLTQQMRGDYANAVRLLQQVLAARPDDALVHTNLGGLLYARGEFEASLTLLRRACELAADFSPAWFNLGRVLQMRGRPAGAITALHRAVDLDPGHVPSRLMLADAQVRVGAMGAASANYREVLRCHPAHPEAWLGLSQLEATRFGPDDVAGLQQVLQISGVPMQARISLGFVLARALEDQADYREAFRVLAKANALMRRQVNWDPAKARVQVDALLDAFAAPLDRTADTQRGEQVIFVVCLPQSGSTLTERILATHPRVEGAGELPDLQQVIDEESARRGQPFPTWVAAATPADWSRLGHDYLARTERWRWHKPRFTDKSLLNWQLVGAALAMLPGAKVVNSRRDAVENCFGCYRQLFEHGHHFSYDLDHLTSYWHDYDRLSRHWQRLFPDRFLEHTHEALQADPDVQIRRLLAFCGLDYEPACLAFQQRQDSLQATDLTQRADWPLGLGTPRSELYGPALNRLRMLLAGSQSHG
ncbi:sulfotransferase [Rhodanobacter sp. Col0626]|uniref:tetratricopeptide repeat-containing sulfotransferase family protein n=1 Tax=Rhodanobacter sp. Col0626 TaxID=3415679 RepID=UPI003CFA4E40